MFIILTACGTKQVTKVDETEKVEEEVEEEIEDPNDYEVKAAEPAYRMNEQNFTFEPIGEAPAKVVLLTIDDAPDQYALEMAHTLKKLRAPAIFFVNGHFLETQEKKAILKEIYDLGFTIGNHTFNHENLQTLSQEKQRMEIISLNDLIENITGERPKFFRAPFGVNTEESKKIVAIEKMLWMNWTYGYDWEKDYMTPDALSTIMVKTELLQDGANILMHDREWTSASLERIVEGLREEGYEILDPKYIDLQSRNE